RGATLFGLAGCVFAVALLPYGPLLALVALMAAAAWTGRDRTPADTGPGEAEAGRLQSLYDALVPYFSMAEDPDPLYAHGGDWQEAFSAYAFDDDGRLTGLELRYPAYFPDGEAEPRARIEQLLHAKSGRGREYLFDWDEEGNTLRLSVLAALPTGIRAQRFVTAPGETVLGFTDPSGVPRTLPVTDGEETRDAPPVVWRTGTRSTEPHLLAVGQPGSGTTTLLRSIVLQALHGGDALVVDGGGTGEYACLA
ncbi:membrane protein, partial [Streptomyces varsoviensis]